MIDLQGKTAIVTGGTTGIGFSSAKEFINLGARVVITGRSKENVRHAAEELGCMGVVADVTSLSAIDELVSTVKSEFRSIDILFVNAGVFAPAPVGQVSEEIYDMQMGINLKGAIFSIEKFLPIIRNGGSIINLSSINAYTGMPMTAIYAASKAALNSYTRTASIELASRKIRVNAVNPGPIETPILGKTGMPEQELGAFVEAMQSSVPLKRLGQASEVAKLVAFLASDDASFITGAEFNIDGGLNVNSVLG